MKKTFSFLVCGLLILNICAMEQEAAHAASDEAYFKKYQVAIPLSLGKPGEKIVKDAFLHIPTKVVNAQVEISKDTCAIPDDISRTVLGMLSAVYEEQGKQELLKATTVCAELMFENDKGWEFPQNGLDFKRVNPELYKLIKLQQSYFVFDSTIKKLLVRWDLGEHVGGWAFDQVIEIQHIPEHPRKGTCSDMWIYYHGSNEKQLSGKVLLSTLREEYAKTGKQTLLSAEKMPKIYKKYTEDEINRMHAQDVAAMALHYVSDPAHLLDALQIDNSSESK